MSTGSVTQLLARLREGDTGAFDRLIPLVYDELRSLARAQLRREDAGHTLGPTALVHEAYLRLTHREELNPGDRGHFPAQPAPAPAGGPVAPGPPVASPSALSQPPGSPARPPTVLVANLLLRVAACSLIVYCLASLSVLDTATTTAEATFGADAGGAVGLVLLFGWAVAIGLLLTALVLLLLAWRNNRGSRAARGWTFAIGFTMLCCCVPLGAAGNSGTTTVDSDRSEFERQLADAMPPWYEPVTAASGLILAIALLAALVLLMLPPANRYFRPPPRPAFYYPYYLQHPYPPRS